MIFDQKQNRRSKMAVLQVSLNEEVLLFADLPRFVHNDRGNDIIEISY